MRKKSDDVPKNIVILVLLVSIIVSITGTWMVLDTIANIPSPVANLIQTVSQGEAALDISYDAPRPIPKESISHANVQLSIQAPVNQT
jgi:hypothetical protein